MQTERVTASRPVNNVPIIMFDVGFKARSLQVMYTNRTHGHTDNNERWSTHAKDLEAKVEGREPSRNLDENKYKEDRNTLLFQCNAARVEGERSRKHSRVLKQLHAC